MSVLSGLLFYALLGCIVGVVISPIIGVVGLAIKNRGLAIGGFVTFAACLVLTVVLGVLSFAVHFKENAKCDDSTGITYNC